MKYILLLFCLIAGAIATGTEDRDAVINKLIGALKNNKDGADNWYSRSSSRRNWLAKQAANNDYNKVKELLHLETSADIRQRLSELYEHTKYWEDRFNNHWGGYDNTYAGWVHGSAKRHIHEAIVAMKKLGTSVTGSVGRLIPLYANHGLAPGRDGLNQATIKIRQYEGYESDSAVSSELHSAITVASKVAANQLAASMESSVEASVAYDMRNSLNIKNTAEDFREEAYVLDLSTPYYVYQEKFTHSLGDGSTLSVWNSNRIISSTPIRQQ